MGVDSNQQPDVVLKAKYEPRHRKLIWRRYRELHRNSELSAIKFFTDEVTPLIDENLNRITLEGDPNYRFDWSVVDDDLKIVRDFLLDSAKDRKFHVKRLHLFDAYVQLSSPKFVALLNARDDLMRMGEIVGYFLRDPQVEHLGYLLAQAKQRILHFFSYDNVDTIGTYDDTRRYLCLFPGDTLEYLFALDFAFKLEDIVPLNDEKLRLYYGFCAPGEDFSPLIMRSYCLRERLAGLLYSKSSLININTETLRRLTFEVFTTDKSFHGLTNIEKLDPSMDGRTAAVFKAMQVHNGLKLGRDLNMVDRNSDEYLRLKKRVDQFAVDYL